MRPAKAPAPARRRSRRHRCWPTSGSAFRSRGSRQYRTVGLANGLNGEGVPPSPGEGLRLRPISRGHQPLEVAGFRKLETARAEIGCGRVPFVAGERDARGNELLGLCRRLARLIEARSLDIDRRLAGAHEPGLGGFAPLLGGVTVDRAGVDAQRETEPMGLEMA